MSTVELALLAWPGVWRSPLITALAIGGAYWLRVDATQFKSTSLAQKFGAAVLFPMFWKTYMAENVLLVLLLPWIFAANLPFPVSCGLAYGVAMGTGPRSAGLTIAGFAIVWHGITRRVPRAFTLLETAILAQAAGLFASRLSLSSFVVAPDASVLFVIAYWTAVLATTLPALVLAQRRWPQLPVVVVRKLFHAVAVFLFAPPLLLWPQTLPFVALASAAVAALLVAAEVCRRSCKRCSAVLTPLLTPFLDAKQEQFLFSHTALLIGCLLPLWMAQLSDSDGDRVRSRPLMYGVVTVGVADAVAAVVGASFQRPTPMPGLGGRGRSVQGFVAFVASVWLCGGALAPATLLSLLETYTDSLDNLLLPIYWRVLSF